MRYAALALAALLCTLPAAAAFTVVEDGKAVAVVAVPDDPTDAELFAAEELVAFVQRMTGAELPLVRGAIPDGRPALVVGRHPDNEAVRTELLHRHPDVYDAFAVVVAGDRAHLVASHSAPQLYTAWEWLERQGVGFLMPGINGMYIPKRTSITADDLDYYAAPAMTIRRAWFFHGTGAAYEARNGIPPSLLAETEHGIAAGLMWNCRARVSGGTIDPKDKIPFLGSGHSYQYYLPASRYDETHPEYMNFLRGRRLNRKDADVQVCFTNADGAKEFAKNMAVDIERQLAEGIPVERIKACVSPNDTKALCECENCATIRDADGTASSQVLHFANLVTAELRKTYPTIRTYYYVYNNHGRIPDHVVPGPGVIPEITSWTSGDGLAVNHAHPLFSDANQRYRSVFTWFAEHAEGLAAYTYYTHYNWTLAPFPVLTQAPDDLRHMAAAGVDCMVGEWHNNWGLQGVTLWLLPRLMWEPNQDVDALLDRYYAMAYGPAADPARRFFDLLQKRMDGLRYVCGVMEELPQLVNPETATACNRLIDQIAGHYGAMDDAMRWRAELLVESWRNAEKMIRAIRMAQQADGKNAKAFGVAKTLLEEALAFSETDQGHWAAEHMLTQNVLNGLLRGYGVDLRAVPAGESTWSSSAYHGGTFGYFARRSGFSPGLWGFMVAPGRTGEMVLPIRAAEGKLAAVTVTVGGKDSVRVSARRPGGKETPLGTVGAALKVPDDLLGQKTLEIVLRADNPGPDTQTVLYNAKLVMTVE